MPPRPRRRARRWRAAAPRGRGCPAPARTADPRRRRAPAPQRAGSRARNGNARRRREPRPPVSGALGGHIGLEVHRVTLGDLPHAGDGAGVESLHDGHARSKNAGLPCQRYRGDRDSGRALTGTGARGHRQAYARQRPPRRRRPARPRRRAPRPRRQASRPRRQAPRPARQQPSAVTAREPRAAEPRARATRAGHDSVANPGSCGSYLTTSHITGSGTEHRQREDGDGRARVRDRGTQRDDR